MPYQFCPRCDTIHTNLKRKCINENCGCGTIITTKFMQPLAQRFYDCDFQVLSATSRISVKRDKGYSIHLSVEFLVRYDIEKVFPDLPEGWYVYENTFSIHDGIVVDNITELMCDFYYDGTGYDTVNDAINAEINKMMDWLNNEGHIAILRLAGFWLS